MAHSMFREQSLESLSSPEQLDRTLKVTSPRSWLLLFAFGVVLISILIWSFTGSVPENVAARGLIIRRGGILPVVSEQGGVLDIMLVESGESIRPTAPIAIIKTPAGAKKIIVSEVRGRVVETLISEGGVINPMSVIATIERENLPLEAVVFVSHLKSKYIKPGMPVSIQLSNVPKEDYGLLKGKVRTVADYPISKSGLQSLLTNDLLENYFLQSGEPVVKIKVDLEEQELNISQYEWTIEKGPPFEISSGTEITMAQIEINSKKPIELALPIKINKNEVALN